MVVVEDIGCLEDEVSHGHVDDVAGIFVEVASRDYLEYREGPSHLEDLVDLALMECHTRDDS
jgi:hypothetical protein